MHPLLEDTRVITVDLDDTLWPCGPVIHQAETSLYQWLLREAPLVAAAFDLAALREHRRALAEREPDRSHDLTWLRREHLSLLLQEFGYRPELALEGIDVFRRARNQVSPFDDVIPALESLRKSHLLVSLTNGNVEMEATPLAGYFTHHIDAATAGAAKPDPAMFELALTQTGERPSVALHLGDDPYRDIAPAMSLGMKAVWVNRTCAEWPSDLERPDGEVKNLAELIPV